MTTTRAVALGIAFALSSVSAGRSWAQAGGEVMPEEILADPFPFDGRTVTVIGVVCECFATGGSALSDEFCTMRFSKGHCPRRGYLGTTLGLKRTLEASPDTWRALRRAGEKRQVVAIHGTVEVYDVAGFIVPMLKVRTLDSRPTREPGGTAPRALHPEPSPTPEPPPPPPTPEEEAAQLITEIGSLQDDAQPDAIRALQERLASAPGIPEAERTALSGILVCCLARSQAASAERYATEASVGQALDAIAAAERLSLPTHPCAAPARARLRAARLRVAEMLLRQAESRLAMGNIRDVRRFVDVARDLCGFGCDGPGSEAFLAALSTLQSRIAPPLGQSDQVDGAADPARRAEGRESLAVSPAELSSSELEQTSISSLDLEASSSALTSPGLAVGLSAFFPGVGQLYSRRILPGVLFLVGIGGGIAGGALMIQSAAWNYDGCGSIATVLAWKKLDHLTSLSFGRSGGSGLGTAPLA